MNKYEKSFLNNSSYLDAVTESKGSIITRAKAIIDNQDNEGVLSLCKFIEKTSESKNTQITKIAQATKEALIKVLGHKRLTEIYFPDNEINDKDFSLEALITQLNQLVGLENVKNKVSDLIAFQKVQLFRKEKGLHSPKNTLHLAFTGNPGTGKTTVARIVGRIYKKLGMLSKGHFVEVSRTDLIAGYQGQTAHKVKSVIEKAKGGVLFIDEAYSITENDHSDSYGRECLTELTKALEDYREDLVVIVAGYTEPMKQFFESNPGLKSRFNTFIEFDDYNSNELLDILCSMCKKEDYVLTDRAHDILEEILSKATTLKQEQFANGRFVRNLFESMLMNHARRIAKVEEPTMLELKELTENDIPTNL